MISTRTGSLFDSGAEALVNPVNCQGAAGRGLALEFRQRYRGNYQAYLSACHSRLLRPGVILTYISSTLILHPRYIINFPTKDDWRQPSRASYIRDGLLALTIEIQRLSIKSVAIPALGCGLGGLLWPEVRVMVESAFDTLPQINVFLYEPSEPQRDS